MPPEKVFPRRMSGSIRRRMAKSAEDNPDGPIAMYVWLWQSVGKRPGSTLIPRSIRFFFMASLDLISLGGWCVRTRTLPAVRSIILNGGHLSRIVRASMLVLAVSLGLSPLLEVSGQDLDVEALIGSWEGKLEAAGGITVVFHVEHGEDGGLTGTMDSPDQGATGIPLSSVTFDDGTLTLVASSVPGTPTFQATRYDGGTTLSGTFSQGGAQVPLELTKRT